MRHKRLKTLLSTVLLSVLALAGTAEAKSSYMTSFRAAYPAAVGSRIDSCLVCHTTTNASPSTRNAYGTAFGNAAHSYAAINAADSDLDGFGNQAEISGFFFPGNAADHPVATLPTVTVAATDATATEAGTTTGQFTVTRTGAATAALTVNYTVAGTATSGSDYLALPGSVQIPAGAAAATVTVTPVNDLAVETDETVALTLGANAAYAVGAGAGATVTIQSDDVAVVLPTVTISATDPTATEVGTTTGQFTVTRTGATTAALAVNYTVTGTATSGSDYLALSGSVQVPAGAATAVIAVTPVNDVALEIDETVVVTLGTSAAYSIGAGASATVTIQSDEVSTLPTVTIAATDALATEAGTTTGRFTLTRTGATTAALTVNYAVAGTATSGSDYQALSGSAQIAAGAATAIITVTPVNDTTVEADETVVATLGAGAGYNVGAAASATVVIQSDEVVTLPTVTIAATDALATEAGTTTGRFTVTRTGATTAALTVSYTVSGTATPGSDYQALSGSAQIAAGAAAAVVTVTPVNDTAVEADETVTATLGANAAYTVGTASSATVLIQSDDVVAAASLTVASTNPASGLSITASPSDNNNMSGGSTQFTLVYNQGAQVTLLAPATSGGAGFSGWSGCTSASGTSCLVVMDTSLTVTANYAGAPPAPAYVLYSRRDTGTAALGLTSPGQTSGSPAVIPLETLSYLLTASGVGAGWQATNYQQVGPTEGYVLWTRGDTGQAALWKIDPSRAAGSPSVIPLISSSYLFSVAGVGAGWQATGYQHVAPDEGYVLWTRVDSGTAALWRIDPSLAAGSPSVIPIVRAAYLFTPTGVGAGWEATGYQHVGPTEGYVLWTRSDIGQAALWKVNPGAGTGVIPITATGYVSPPVGGSWQATGYQHIGPDEGYLLWTQGGTGLAALWKINPAASASGAFPPAAGMSYLYSTSGVGGPWQATDYSSAAAGAVFLQQ